MRIRRCCLIATLVLSTPPILAGDEVSVWRSSEDGRWSLTRDRNLSLAPAATDVNAAKIIVDPTQQYQRILGFGASFDHASCYNLSRLDESAQRRALKMLFDPVEGIGMNLMRVCIGTSDFVGEPWYTYDDLPSGETDPSLKLFSIAKDRKYVLPIIKAALRVNPELKCYASPWSPPAWMKTNQSLLGGRIDRAHFDAYARYFLKFIEAYRDEGVPIRAVTLQNEPHYPNPEYPTCGWSAEEQRDFIRDHVGPLLEAEAPETEIWCWDHNWNELEFPRTVLNDRQAAPFVDATAFHLYEGPVAAQSQLREEFPDKSIYFTEGSTFKTAGAVEIIEILNNWSRSYNFWVFMLDELREPNNGPHDASATPIELLDDMSYRVNFDYYMYGQFMKFIERDAQRIGVSTADSPLVACAFENPGGQFVLVVANATDDDAEGVVQSPQGRFVAHLPERSVATYLWRQ